MTTYAVVHSAQQYHVSTCILYVWPSVVSPLLPFRVRLQKEVAIAEQTVAENIQTNNELHQKLRCAHTHIHMYNSNLYNVTEVWGVCIRPAESLHTTLYHVLIGMCMWSPCGKATQEFANQKSLPLPICNSPSSMGVLVFSSSLWDQMVLLLNMLLPIADSSIL